ncbi:MAG: hypothetical protein ABL921_10020 [Pirellula sp.]
MYLTLQLTKYLSLSIVLSFNAPFAQQEVDLQEVNQPAIAARPPQLEQPSSTPPSPAPPASSPKLTPASSPTVPPVSTPTITSAPSPTASPAPSPTASPAPSSPQAEWVSKESFDIIAGEPATELDNADTVSTKKLFNDNTPDWVKQGLVLGDDHSLSISSSLLSDLAQCREDLDARLLSEVQSYLDKHVLEHIFAHQLPELTKEYVEKYWLNKSQSFDNVQDRPSGTYHQLWVGLHISADQLKKVRDWERRGLQEKRVKQIGVLGGTGVAVITLFSGLVGVLARREKAKLKA